MLRFIAGATLIVALSSVVAWAARRHVLTSPRFAVVAIDVRGARSVTPDRIIEAGGIKKGENVFAINLDEAHERILQDPWIREVTLARRLPGTILIAVTEREAGAIVSLGDSYVATRDGEIFKRLESGDPSDLPVITGLTASVAEDRESVARSVRRAIDLAGDYEQSTMGRVSALEEVHIATDGTMTLIVGRDALALTLGQPPFRRKLEQASRVLSELDRRHTRANAILLDNEARPERVVVRVR